MQTSTQSVHLSHLKIKKQCLLMVDVPHTSSTQCKSFCLWMYDTLVIMLHWLCNSVPLNKNWKSVRSGTTTFVWHRARCDSEGNVKKVLYCEVSLKLTVCIVFALFIARTLFPASGWIGCNDWQSGEGQRYIDIQPCVQLYNEYLLLQTCSGSPLNFLHYIYMY